MLQIYLLTIVFYATVYIKLLLSPIPIENLMAGIKY